MNGIIPVAKLSPRCLIGDPLHGFRKALNLDIDLQCKPLHVSCILSSLLFFLTPSLTHSLTLFLDHVFLGTRIRGEEEMVPANGCG